METAIEQIRSLSSNGTEATRKEIIDQLRELSYSLETQDDTLQRIMYTGLQIAVVRIGIDLKIFELLTANKKPMTLEQFQQKTGAAIVLLGRLLRYLASTAIIKGVSKDTFTATNVTDALAIPGNQGGVSHF